MASFDHLLREIDEQSRQLVELCNTHPDRYAHIDTAYRAAVFRGLQKGGKHSFHDEVTDFDDHFQAACIDLINKQLGPEEMDRFAPDYRCAAVCQNSDPQTYDPGALEESVGRAHGTDRKEAQFLLLAWVSASSCEQFMNVTKTRMNYDFKWMLHQSRNALAHAPLRAHQLGLVRVWADVLTDRDPRALKAFLEVQVIEMRQIKQRIWH